MGSACVALAAAVTACLCAWAMCGAMCGAMCARTFADLSMHACVISVIVSEYVHA